jgi:thiosulfate dehydrogenase [quinone] large subunit
VAHLRNRVTAIGVVAALFLLYLVNPWVEPPDGPVRQVVTVAFWVLAIALIVVLFRDRKSPESSTVEIEGPAFTRYLLSNSRAGILWLPIRLFVGFAWLEAGLGKLGEAGWTGGGAALRAYWERAVTIPEQGRPPISYEWYRDFINTLLNGNSETWFSWVVVLGEIAIGAALIVGLLTGAAAFFGALMNMSFLLAGSASTNPVLFALAIGLILAWRVAGYYGVDRYLLPRLGTPWRPGVLATRRQPRPSGTPVG